MSHVFILLILLVDAKTGEMKNLQELQTYSTLQECEAARVYLGPQRIMNGEATVFICAQPKKDS